MKKIVVAMVFFLISVSLSAQVSVIKKALSIEESIVLYENDLGIWQNESVIELIKKLLPNGINTKNDDGYTPLIYASYAGYTELVKSLIVAGADIDAKDNGGGAALMHATQGGYAEILKEAGATE